MYKILVVEDDPAIRQVLERQLAKWDYMVQAVTDFTKVIEAFEEQQPHLVLLDITLPFYSGYYWCEQLRLRSQVPILFISSAGDDLNQIMAMNLGADDFVVKPFGIEVVIAKIQALMRRAYSFGGRPNVLCYADVTVNLGEANLGVGDATVELTKNELKILQLLVEAKGAVVTREEIMRRLWQDESFIDENTLTVNIGRLRRKCEEAGIADLITTRKGIGYALRRGEA